MGNHAEDVPGSKRHYRPIPVKMDWEEVKKVVDAILKRGNDAEIRRKGDGYIVLETKKAIKYTST